LRINYAIVSCDENPYYLDFWPVVAWAWKRIGIEPVLLKVCSGHKIYNDEHGLVIEMPLVPGIKPSFQSQVVRNWAWKLLDGNLILSDIDMLPVSREYFHGNAEPHSEEKIVVYCSDAYQENEYPMCYILANSEVIKPLIEQETWPEFVAWLVQNCGEGWSTDQWHITKICKEYGNLVKIKRGWNSAGVATNRLDRIGWEYNCENAKNFYDAHLLRPYSENKEKINHFISCING
jgi:hypothetical protein